MTGTTTAPTSRPLADRTALVTGAGQGMGTAHARRLAAEGARVVVADRTRTEALVALAEELGGLAVGFDAADADATARALDPAAVGEIDLLVANHAYMSMGPYLEADEDDWWRVVDTNLTGTRHLVHAVLPGMRRRGAGRIVVITSEWGLTGWPQATAYSAAKSGLVALVKTLGRELAPAGVLVNGIAPGVIDTPQLEVDARDAGVSLDEVKDRYSRGIPLGRVGRPEEVSAVVALLCNPRLRAMTGQIVQVNGGELRCRA